MKKAEKQTERAAVNKVTKEQAEKAIQTICKAASIYIYLTDIIEEGLAPQFEATATALRKHFGLDDSVMNEYRNGIEKAKTADKADNILFTDAEEARDIVYQMCEELTEPAEIMQHVIAMREMLYIAEPSGYPRRRKTL